MKQIGWAVAALAWMLSPLALEQGFWPWMMGFGVLFTVSLWTALSRWRVTQAKSEYRIDHLPNPIHRNRRIQQTRRSGSSQSSAPTTGTAQPLYELSAASHAIVQRLLAQVVMDSGKSRPASGPSTSPDSGSAGQTPSSTQK